MKLSLGDMVTVLLVACVAGYLGFTVAERPAIPSTQITLAQR